MGKKTVLVVAGIALLVAGIPWYWPDDNHAIALGMPGWVVIAIIVSFGASAFTASPWAYDGKIFALELTNVMRIRTGDTDADAL